MKEYDLSDLKLVYRVLHGQLLGNPELIDSRFFHELQTHLQGRARADGVDLADHAQWDAWLRR
jgi:hypothetical protein